MSKKKGDGLKSFNKGFQVPDTYHYHLFCSCYRGSYDIPCAQGLL